MMQPSLRKLRQLWIRQSSWFHRPWLSVVLIPLLTVALGTAGWYLWGPKPSIPVDLNQPDTLSQKVRVHSSSAKAVSNLVATPSGNSASTATSAAANAGHTSDSRSLPALPTGKQTLVALGDSITFGYNLPGASATTASPYAYPYIVGRDKHMQVDNLGVPGWESADVLHALQTTKFRKAIAAANVVTLDIGSNDLLHTSYDLAAMANTTPPAKNQVMSDPLFQQSLAQYSKNLPAILTQLRTLTKAPIVLLNLYNPFPDGSDLHAVAEQVVAAANQVIYATAARFDVPVADIHSVFNHQQATDVRIEALDIHPTVTGQQAIADAVEDVLSRPLWHQPLLFAVSTKGTLVYSTTRPGPFAIYWLSPDDGLPVTGEQNGWVTVTTPNGQKGYVPADKVTVLLRADPDVQFDTEVNEVAGGLIVDSVSERASSVWLWKNTLYAPVTYLAKNANATVTYNAAEHEVDIDTPQHSGLVQTGLLNPLPVDAPYPVPHVVMQIQLDGKTHRVTAEEAGIEVVIDGNPVNLQAPALWIQGQVYVPILTFWSDLGGTITHDAKGLPILSAGAS